MCIVKQEFEAAGVDTLIGAAITEWAGGGPRAAQDLDLVVKIPIKSISELIKKLNIRESRDRTAESREVWCSFIGDGF